MMITEQKPRKQRKPRAKKVVMDPKVGDIQTIEVPVVKNPGWETPIYEILGHPKFDELLAKELKNCRDAEIKPGYHIHPYLQKVLDKYYFYPEQLKIEYIKMLNKDSQEPAGMRTFIKQIVETAIFLTIKFYEGEKQS